MANVIIIISQFKKTIKCNLIYGKTITATKKKSISNI